ncbi:MAG TPA: glutathione S-transferase N-terminal domain-containing protein [Kofleriaceae bacterium]|nr:glutathione S-transferase N-terminal domain-containing protein [Kofleriaceae bacterium]
MNRTLDVLSSWASSTFALGGGTFVATLGPRPAQPLELYEWEACPFCRRVREALSILDLEARVFPCPKGGNRFRDRVRELGGRLQFPFLVDPNTGEQLYESGDIVRYLFRTYGAGRVPLQLRGGRYLAPAGRLASAARVGKGVRVRASRLPAEPLELWSFESSPYCRIAREALCQLELPYLLHNVAKGSPSRPAFVERSGRMMVPYLADPNTGAEMFESADIVRYLYDTYAI